MTLVLCVSVYLALHITDKVPAFRSSERLADYHSIIARHAKANDLPVDLVEAVVLAESSANPRAVSPKGAKGLMQITPIAERDVLQRTGTAGGDLFNPEYNIRIGTLYLRQMYRRFDRDVCLALAAYNAGPARISRLRKKYPNLSSRELIDKHAPRETAAYCKRILRRLGQ